MLLLVVSSIDSYANVVSWTINLGPVQTIWKNIPPNPQSDGLGYNPRCLSRELNPQASMNTTEDDVVSLILKSADIASFQDTMQYVVPGDLGIHGGGHYTIGGDANGDLFNSASDPAFFAHHSMIDLVWWTWQSLGLEMRQNAVAGTVTFMNNPPSRNTTLDDTLELGYTGAPNITIASAMNTLAGPFCYIYA
jgi:tyrosinase